MPLVEDSNILWRKFLRGYSLRMEEYRALCKNILSGTYSEAMLATIVARIYYKPLGIDEIYKLVEAFVETGDIITFDSKYVVDKHSIGGVPGNKVSLLIVPIVAAAGLTIPKTATRSITTIGTAEKMNVFAPVDLTMEEVKEVVKKTKGCLVSTKKLNLAPVDDVLLNVQSELKINPATLMIASILAKKKAMGIKYMVLDIPQGRGTKVKTLREATRLANKFIAVADRLDMYLQCAITYGEQPIGHTVGVALEAREALETLYGGKPSTSLIEKSTGLAGILFEMAGITSEGQRLAKSMLESGKALEKFREIIEAQGGNPNIRVSDIPIGTYKIELRADTNGYVVQIDNTLIMEIARKAGAPKDIGAGVIIPYKGGRYVKEGSIILRIFSNNESRLDEAYKFAQDNPPVVIEGSVRRIIKPMH
ncbi:MAG: thymidine phosphorylase [Candidatus Njordarchaeota archaeon]